MVDYLLATFTTSLLQPLLLSCYNLAVSLSLSRRPLVAHARHITPVIRSERATKSGQAKLCSLLLWEVWEDGGLLRSLGRVVGHAAFAYGKKVGKIKKGILKYHYRESWGKPGTCDR